MTCKPTITIIVPVYKVEDYISDCIKSIIQQTFKDFELIIVDDSSPDKSVDIARKLLDEAIAEDGAPKNADLWYDFD